MPTYNIETEPNEDKPDITMKSQVLGQPTRRAAQVWLLAYLKKKGIDHRLTAREAKKTAGEVNMRTPKEVR